jgi:hypothetical protein
MSCCRFRKFVSVRSRSWLTLMNTTTDPGVTSRRRSSFERSRSTTRQLHRPRVPLWDVLMLRDASFLQAWFGGSEWRQAEESTFPPPVFAAGVSNSIVPTSFPSCSPWPGGSPFTRKGEDQCSFEVTHAASIRLASHPSHLHDLNSGPTPFILQRGSSFGFRTIVCVM